MTLDDHLGARVDALLQAARGDGRRRLLGRGGQGPGGEDQRAEDAEGHLRGYGVDHVTVVQGLGCKALRVTDPEQIAPALQQAQQLARQHRVPVVVECILEKVTNIAMGTEIDKINE